MLSVALTLLSAISAAAAVLPRSPMTTRFGLSFLGLFSSLIVLLHVEGLSGGILVLTSGIILPCVLTLKLEEVNGQPSRHPQLIPLVLYLAAAFVATLFVGLKPLEAGLIGLVFVGLAALNLRASSPRSTLSSIVMSQAIPVIVSLRNAPIWLTLLLELFRLTFIMFASSRCRQSKN